ncbi:hypothetical protein SCHPADRAFT_307364 [Schizopora paradoxa]|uniref:Uncharacterized protein n=1 Tax=Schizopora paradoxa TaxID=27342 RepID=A0A0H2RRQ4_9AGAM|nr:hypothetical protein SCHPADRAFT_307364 [Schizopora paradoxa]
MSVGPRWASEKIGRKEIRFILQASSENPNLFETNRDCSSDKIKKHSKFLFAGRGGRSPTASVWKPGYWRVLELSSWYDGPSREVIRSIAIKASEGQRADRAVRSVFARVSCSCVSSAHAVLLPQVQGFRGRSCQIITPRLYYGVSTTAPGLLVFYQVRCIPVLEDSPQAWILSSSALSD